MPLAQTAVIPPSLNRTHRHRIVSINFPIFMSAFSNLRGRIECAAYAFLGVAAYLATVADHKELLG
jgi:hypothetical protein